MKKVLVTGGSGLVGSRFVELCSNKYKIYSPDSSELDITNSDSIKTYLAKFNPEVLINFAAYTDVTRAEDEKNNKEGLVWKLNVEAVSNLRRTVSDDIFFIQISTDMVFSGSKEDPGPYAEDHKVEENSDKVTWYGFTKGQGEKQLAGRPNTVILRLIYPVRAKYALKLDYLRKPLSLYDQGKLYPIFNDQQISFSFVDEICVALEKIINGNRSGIFHAGSRDTTTPYEAISYLISLARGVKNAVKPLPLDDFLKTVDSTVRYPKYGGLKVQETEARLGIKFNGWEEIINQLVRQGISV